MGKYEDLKKAVVENIALMRIGEATLDDLEKAVTNATTIPRTCIYHPQHGDKSVETTEVKKFLNDGWYRTPADFPPERPDFLTPEEWDICDKRLVHEWGLSLSSFTESVKGLNKKDPSVKETQRETYDKVIAHYGDTIDQVERNQSTIWKLKE